MVFKRIEVIRLGSKWTIMRLELKHDESMIRNLAELNFIIRLLYVQQSVLRQIYATYPTETNHWIL